MVPAARPLTVPPEDMVATPVALLLQVPPAGDDDRAIVLPAHTVAGPVIGLITGNVSTVTTFVENTVPHILVTV